MLTDAKVSEVSMAAKRLLLDYTEKGFARTFAWDCMNASMSVGNNIKDPYENTALYMEAVG